MIATTKMSTRGQVIIPKHIREQLNADKNTSFVVTALDENTIVMKKLDTTQLLKEFNALRKTLPKFSEEEIQQEINAHRST